MFGDFYHGKGANRPLDYEDERRKVFARYGFDLLVIWQHELDNEDAVLARIKSFTEAWLEARKVCRME